MSLRKKGSLESSIYTKRDGNATAVILYARRVGKVWRKGCLLSGKVASLFLSGSPNYLQEAWVIPRQVGGRICLFPAETAGSRFFLSPPQSSWRDTRYVEPSLAHQTCPPGEVAKACRHSEVIAYSHTGTASPEVTAANAGGNDLDTQGHFMTASLAMRSF